ECHCLLDCSGAVLL
nr:immunoglobulin light chain junction region [Macaca mulatta]